MYKVGEVSIAVANGKEVKIIAKDEQGDNICRYVEDINGKHPNRCYVYKDCQLEHIKKNVTEIYDLSILYGSEGRVIAKIPYTRYPSKEEIVNQIINYKGTDASVKKRFKLT